MKYIRSARRKVDYLILSIHWGKEYEKKYYDLRKKAKKLFKAGVDCIIGHHPHILLPIEYEKDDNGLKNIAAYSLGNFVANIGKDYTISPEFAYYGSARRSIILSLQLRKVGDSVFAEKIEVVPIWIHNNYIEYKAGKVKNRYIYPVCLLNCPENILSEKKKKKEVGLIMKELKINSLTLE